MFYYGTASAPGRNRTFNLPVKSRLLCLIELQGLVTDVPHRHKRQVPRPPPSRYGAYGKPRAGQAVICSHALKRPKDLYLHSRAGFYTYRISRLTVLISKMVPSPDTDSDSSRDQTGVRTGPTLDGMKLGEGRTAYLQGDTRIRI